MNKHNYAGLNSIMALSRACFKRYTGGLHGSSESSSWGEATRSNLDSQNQQESRNGLVLKQQADPHTGGTIQTVTVPWGYKQYEPNDGSTTATQQSDREPDKYSCTSSSNETISDVVSTWVRWVNKHAARWTWSPCGLSHLKHLCAFDIKNAHNKCCWLPPIARSGFLQRDIRWNMFKCRNCNFFSM